MTKYIEHFFFTKIFILFSFLSSFLLKTTYKQNLTNLSLISQCEIRSKYFYYCIFSYHKVTLTPAVVDISGTSLWKWFCIDPSKANRNWETIRYTPLGWIIWQHSILVRVIWVPRSWRHNLWILSVSSAPQTNLFGCVPQIVYQEPVDKPLRWASLTIHHGVQEQCRAFDIEIPLLFVVRIYVCM